MKSGSGATAAHYAMAAGHLETCIALLEDQKDIVACLHAPDAHGFSALHYANANGHVQVAADMLRACSSFQNDHVSD